MVASTFEYEVTSTIPPERLIKALSFDKSYVPKVFPQGVRSIDLLEGDGGVGSIFLITYAEGSHVLKSAKHRIDKVDKENLIYSHTILEVELASGPADDGVESVSDVIALSPSGDGGSVVKASCTYNTKGDVGVSEEQVRGKERIEFMVKNVQEFLMANPDAYVIN
ncbi:OLC1v1033412C1 [Oldenlandia corymbosa var. corymbosa]|uniref:OLC1v1033412C1 n=1 Tax=Oldenlandia corymbosa var. corymbosa TaxID=529605 RepID=A0AAV1CRG1_OLDCO|nr:OLC1v1033412C1 [Oldenlandia corymbosa var. corymbosa]